MQRQHMQGHCGHAQLQHCLQEAFEAMNITGENSVLVMVEQALDINIVTRSPFVTSFQVDYSITHTF